MDSMNEKVIKKRIKVMVILVLFLTIILGSGTSAILLVLKSVQVNVRSTDVKKQLKEYNVALDRQFEADFQILSTLAPFLKDLGDIRSKKFLQSLEKANLSNTFIKMAYFTPEKEGVLVDIHHNGSQKIVWNSLEKTLQTVVEKALNEQKVISDIYEDTDTKEHYIGYAVPVYKNEQVQGVLVGINSLSVYSNILSMKESGVSNFDIYMVDNEANVFISFEDQLIQRNKYEAISLMDQEKVEKFIQSGKQGSVQIRVNHELYPLYFQPMSQNGWYLLALDVSYEKVDSIQYLITIVGIVVAGILILYGIFILAGYRLFVGSIRELVQLAYYDRLTGAYNLDKFRQRASELLGQEERYSLAILNIRRFRYINDVLGMKKADEILCEVRNILEKALEPEEIYCRNNSDQFYILLKETDKEILKQRIMEIQQTISNISNYIDNNYKVTTCVGVSIQETQKQGKKWEEELLHQAEFAVKCSKSGHTNQIVFYSDKVHRMDYEQGSIENDMEESLKNGEFQMFLQPKVSLHDQTIKGAEALVRWIKEDGTIIYPDLFIPAFERNGFCSELDMYMVEQACKKLREWLDKGYEPIQISVNQSKRLFYQAHYIERLCKIREKYQIPARLIMLEILEGLAVGNVQELNEVIKQLQEKGFEISMDDFGAGYSSLNVLGSLEINELKLDRQFLMPSTADNEKKQRTIMKNIVRLAKDLSIRIVVEGVETKENEEFIKSIGCDTGQGYYYSRPIPTNEFEDKFMKK